MIDVVALSVDTIRAGQPATGSNSLAPSRLVSKGSTMGNNHLERYEQERERLRAMTLDDATSEMSTRVYSAALFYEHLEGVGKVSGNAHHAAQHVCAFANAQLLARWRAEPGQSKAPQIEGCIAGLEALSQYADDIRSALERLCADEAPNIISQVPSVEFRDRAAVTFAMYPGHVRTLTVVVAKLREMVGEEPTVSIQCEHDETARIRLVLAVQVDDINIAIQFGQWWCDTITTKPPFRVAFRSSLSNGGPGSALRHLERQDTW